MLRIEKTERRAAKRMAEEYGFSQPPLSHTEAKTRGEHRRKCADAWETVSECRDRRLTLRHA